MTDPDIREGGGGGGLLRRGDGQLPSLEMSLTYGCSDDNWCNSLQKEKKEDFVIFQALYSTRDAIEQPFNGK